MSLVWYMATGAMGSCGTYWSALDCAVPDGSWSETDGSWWPVRRARGVRDSSGDERVPQGLGGGPCLCNVADLFGRVPCRLVPGVKRFEGLWRLCAA